MSNAKDTNKWEEWTEPFADFAGVGSMHKELLVPLAVAGNLLSRRALLGIQSFIEEGGEEWGEESEDFFSDGDESTLYELCLYLLKQSHDLACTRYDEPGLAIFSLSILLESFKMASSHYLAREILTEIMSQDELACTRTVALMNTELRFNFQELPASFSRKALVKNVLSDMRLLLKRKDYSSSEFVASGFFRSRDVILGFGESLADGLELLYLKMETKMVTANFEAAKQLSCCHTFEKSVDASLDFDELTSRRRCLLSSVARLHEALGELELAEDLYSDCGYTDEATKINKVLSERRPFWAHNPIPTDISVDKILGASEMKGGSLAIFASLPGDTKSEIGFFVWSRDGTLSRRELPFDGKRWIALRVLPNAPSDRLLLLVGSQTPWEASPSRTVSELTGLGSKENTLAQVWEYDDHMNWRELQCRGCIPDRRVVDTPGSGCIRVGRDRIVLFAHAPSSECNCPRCMGSSGVFIFCLETNEWRQVGHPYDQEGSDDVTPTGSFPFVSAVTEYQSKDGNPMVMLLRARGSLINEKRGNQLVPKYVVDVFRQAHCSPAVTKFGKRAWEWNLDVPTQDKSCYVAKSCGVKAISVTGTLLVLGAKKHERVERPKLAKFCVGMNCGTSPPPSMDLLDCETMEWRGLDIHNEWLLSGDLEASELLLSNDGESCHLVAIDKGRLRLLTLHNAKSIRKCIRDRVSEKKLMSKKYTQCCALEKSCKTRAKPLHSCASCGKFEAPGVSPFKFCSRCRVTFYCSRECQAWHWKVKGGHHKAQCKPYQEEKPYNGPTRR